VWNAKGRAFAVSLFCATICCKLIPLEQEQRVCAKKSSLERSDRQKDEQIQQVPRQNKWHVRKNSCVCACVKGKFELFSASRQTFFCHLSLCQENSICLKNNIRGKQKASSSTICRYNLVDATFALFFNRARAKNRKVRQCAKLISAHGFFAYRRL
jgi:hypothetical protein